jgi:dimethylhistidine N-methyltransferase
MTTIDLPAVSSLIDQRIAAAVRGGLASWPKSLPPWLFYDAVGSRLFDQITDLPEYYLTRTEREIFAAHAGEMMARASGASTAGEGGARLRLIELGAGSADKTRLLLAAAVARQGNLLYEPVDVSATALEAARERIESELPGVEVAPQVMDYTNGFELDPVAEGERRLVLYIGSSIGNFEPEEAAALLSRLRAELDAGDGLLLGVDLRKEDSVLLAAYDDAAGVTAAFNRNILVRLNREFDGDFVPEDFAHVARWNDAASRIEMHLESRSAQRVRLAALGLDVEFAAGETIHTENSYKYAPGQVESLLSGAGFSPVERWTDARERFAVWLGRAE